MDMNHTVDADGIITLWYQLSIFFVTQLTAYTQRHTLTIGHSKAKFDGRGYSNLLIKTEITCLTNMYEDNKDDL